MTGREFEGNVVKMLHKHGYWALRIPQNEAGQQPFDILAIRGDKVVAYDCKVVSDGKNFPLDRIEDNQLNSFRLMEKKTAAQEIGLLIFCPDGIIRFMDISRINTEIWLGKKSVKLESLPEWGEMVQWKLWEK